MASFFLLLRQKKETKEKATPDRFTGTKSESHDLIVLTVSCDKMYAAFIAKSGA
jgi:hypothetical protein